MIHFTIDRGFFAVRGRLRRLFWIKDVRRAETVLFSDRYAAWHIGPFAVQAFGFPRVGHRSAADASARAARLMAWRGNEKAGQG